MHCWSVHESVCVYVLFDLLSCSKRIFVHTQNIRDNFEMREIISPLTYHVPNGSLCLPQYIMIVG